MREIKFRAWDKTWNRYYETVWDIRPNDNFILMQFTGLTDKNGKKIYEGDIIKDNKDGAIGLVIYTPPIFSVKLKEKLNEEEYWNLGAGKVYPDNYKLVDTEVIGNIYSNPELLREAK